MNITPQGLTISIVIILLLGIFTPVIMNTRPKIHCDNVSDTTGGYNQVCTDPTFISVYTKYISKDY